MAITRPRADQISTGEISDTEFHFVDSMDQHVSSSSPVNFAGLILNEAGSDVDCRFEGASDENLFYLDAGNDGIGIGKSNPAYKLDVAGGVGISDGLNISSGDITVAEDAHIGLANAYIHFNGGLSRVEVSNALRIGTRVIFDNALDSNEPPENIAIGRNSLYTSINTPQYNVAIGYATLYSNTTGEQNVAVGGGGFGALHYNTTGSFNTAIGVDALQSSIDGNDNTGVGLDALLFLEHGSGNTAVGSEACLNGYDSANYTINNTTAVGYRAGYFVKTGASNNTFLGALAGSTTTTGSGSILIGYNITAPTAATSNYLNIGGLITGILSTGGSTYITNGLVVNESGGDYDTRIEGDTDANLLFVDASIDRIGISTSAPQSLLDIQGPVGTGAATAGILTLATKETTIVTGDALGRINFNSPLSAVGGDSILPGAAIWAEADATFSTTNNSTDIVFGTATSSVPIERMRIDSYGYVGIGTNDPHCALEVWSIYESIRATVEGSANTNVVTGIVSDVTGLYTGDSSSIAYGVDVAVTTAGGIAYIGTSYGIRTVAGLTAGKTGSKVYGGYFSATSTLSTLTNYGIYATAANGGEGNYAGYFAGAVYTTGQLTSSLAIGTAPLAVTSTTLCSNLNADLLDGQHGSYYATAVTGGYLPLSGGTMTGDITMPEDGHIGLTGALIHFNGASSLVEISSGLKCYSICTSGDYIWDLGTYSTTTSVATGKITVTIDGNTYQINAKLLPV